MPTFEPKQETGDYNAFSAVSELQHDIKSLEDELSELRVDVSKAKLDTGQMEASYDEEVKFLREEISNIRKEMPSADASLQSSKAEMGKIQNDFYEILSQPKTGQSIIGMFDDAPNSSSLHLSLSYLDQEIQQKMGDIRSQKSGASTTSFARIHPPIGKSLLSTVDLSSGLSTTDEEMI